MENFKLYRNIFLGSIVVAISRSGNTTEILNAIKAIKKETDVPVMGITCVEDFELNKIAVSN